MCYLGSICTAALLLLGVTSATSAQEGKYPTDSITAVVAFSPGGGTDTMARLISPDLGKALGQSIVVDNRPGAGGFLGWRSVASAKPDGYTILVSENAIAINPALRQDQRFNPGEDLEAIAQIATAPLVVLVNKNVKANSLQELVELSKKDPTALTFSSSGIGSVSHVSFEAFARAVGISATHIPYKGGGEALTAVVSGEVSATINAIPASKPMVEQGEVKAIMVTGSDRASVLPDVPSQKELGVDAGIGLGFWFGIFAPRGIPENVKTTLRDAVKAVVSDPTVQERMAKLGISPAFADSDDLKKRVMSDLEYWGDLIKKAGIKAE